MEDYTVLPPISKEKEFKKVYKNTIDKKKPYLRRVSTNVLIYYSDTSTDKNSLYLFLTASVHTICEIL